MNTIFKLTPVALARGRNWQKARLIGSSIDTTFLTEKEKDLVQTISHIKIILLKNWDKGSEDLGLNVQRYNLDINQSLPDEPPIYVRWKSNIPYSEVNFLTRNISKKDYKMYKVK